MVTAGSALGRRLTLGDELVIGREVSGRGARRRHRALAPPRPRCPRRRRPATIEDLGSANGTFVNGERVRGRQVLKVGDSVRVGSTILQLTDGGRGCTGLPHPRHRRPPRAPATPRRRARSRRARGADGSRPGPGQRGAPRFRWAPWFAGCRVEEVISHGDMGVVYRAEELALQRRVALKLILPEYSREERFRERFRRESRVAAAIDHPNVIPIFDAGDEGGVLYIMMRYVEGTDLGELIAAGGTHRAATGRAHRPPGRRGAGRGPRSRHAASRRQAFECPARPRGPRVPERLRPRQACRRRAGD